MGGGEKAVLEVEGISVTGVPVHRVNCDWGKGGRGKGEGVNVTAQQILSCDCS